jgi:GNAT superfamily N-acetyltransferase
MTGKISFEHAKLVMLHSKSRSAFYRAVARGSPGARVIELDGVAATAVPAAPWFALLNTVFNYDGAQALDAALPELANEYAHDGVQSWSVSVPAGDQPARELLERRGFACKTSFLRVAGELSALDVDPRTELDLVSEPTWEDIAHCNDRAYGLAGRAMMATAFVLLRDPAVRLYAARLDGEVVSAMIARDEGTDVYVTFGATVPEAQRKGTAAELLRHIVRAASERGCRTGTGETNSLSTHMCLKFGLTALGALEQWECGAAATPRARGTEAAAGAAPAPSSHRRPPG